MQALVFHFTSSYLKRNVHNPWAFLLTMASDLRENPLFSGEGTSSEAGAWGGMCHKGTFLIIKDNSKGKQWLNIHGCQQKPNAEPSSADGDTGCCKARADAREGTSHKPNRSPVQSLASGSFSCQPCLVSSHNVWLLCRKQQRMRLKGSMLCPASKRTKQCQEKAAVPHECQCALEWLFYFLKGQQNSCKKKRPDPTQRTISPILVFQKTAIPVHSPFFSQGKHGQVPFCFSPTSCNLTSKPSQQFISHMLLNFYFLPPHYYLPLCRFQKKLSTELCWVRWGMQNLVE